MRVEGILRGKGAEVETIRPDAKVQMAVRRLRGIVSVGDVVKHRLEEMQLETDVLRDAYLSHR